MLLPKVALGLIGILAFGNVQQVESGALQAALKIPLNVASIATLPIKIAALPVTLPLKITDGVLTMVSNLLVNDLGIPFIERLVLFLQNIFFTLSKILIKLPATIIQLVGKIFGMLQGFGGINIVTFNNIINQISKMLTSLSGLLKGPLSIITNLPFVKTLTKVGGQAICQIFVFLEKENVNVPKYLGEVLGENRKIVEPIIKGKNSFLHGILVAMQDNDQTSNTLDTVLKSYNIPWFVKADFIIVGDIVDVIFGGTITREDFLQMFFKSNLVPKRLLDMVFDFISVLTTSYEATGGSNGSSSIEIPDSGSSSVEVQGIQSSAHHKWEENISTSASEEKNKKIQEEQEAKSQKEEAEKAKAEEEARQAQEKLEREEAEKAKKEREREEAEKQREIEEAKKAEEKRVKEEAEAEVKASEGTTGGTTEGPSAGTTGGAKEGGKKRAQTLYVKGKAIGTFTDQESLDALWDEYDRNQTKPN